MDHPQVMNDRTGRRAGVEEIWRMLWSLPHDLVWWLCTKTGPLNSRRRAVMNCRSVIFLMLACCVCPDSMSADDASDAAKAEAVRKWKLQLNLLGRREKLLGTQFTTIGDFDDTSGNVVIGIPVTLEQVNQLSQFPAGRGGLTIPERRLFRATCEVVHQVRTQPTTSSNVTRYQIKYYNILGQTVAQTNHASIAGYAPIPTDRSELLKPMIHGNNTLSVRARLDYVEPEVFYGVILKNRKTLKILEDSGLKDQVVLAINQVMVLNSTIENGQLVLKKPGYSGTPRRTLSFDMSEDGTVEVKLEGISSAERAKLKDAHNNAGEYKDIQGVPVGELLPPES